MGATSDSLPVTKLNCTQCGGELHPDEGQVFITCLFCGSTVYLDKSQVVFHWYLAPTLDEKAARAALARWMAGNQTVKDLDKKAHLKKVLFEYFPVWYFKCRRPNGGEAILLEPASATSVSELKSLTLSAGDLKKYVSDLDSEARTPTVPFQAARKWLEARQVSADSIMESALVHLPVYTFKYTFDGSEYTALVEAATGKTLANIYPAKAEAPYRLVAGLSALAFIGLAFVPVLGALIGEESGAMIGSLICLGVGIPVGLVLFMLAGWVAAKV